MNETSINQLFKEALDARQAGHSSRAKSLCEEIIAREPNEPHALHLLGMLEGQLGRFKEAIDYLERVLLLQPNSPIAHNHMANALSKLNQMDLAVTHYRQAIQLDADYFDAHYNLGLLFLKQALFDEAIKEFSHVLKISPSYSPARLNLANVFLQRHQWDEAISLYKEILALYPQHIDTLNNLGAAYMKKGETIEAIRCFSTVLRIEEHNTMAKSNLAATLIQQERYRDAIWHYQELLKLTPDDQEAHYNLGVAQMAMGELSEAIQHFERTLTLKSDHQDARNNLATALLKIGRKQEALAQFEESLRINPDNPPVRYLVDAITGKTAAKTAPPAYVTHLFDDYANHFEKHVTDILHYRTPSLLRQFVEANVAIPNGQWKILDLGCGTGLSGEVFRDSASQLVGVDLSSKMIDIARSKNLYDELIVDEMSCVLKQRPNQFDLIVAADVFVYVGDLSVLFETIYHALRPKGFLVFSTEVDHLNETYTLQSTARYAHAKVYITSLAEHLGFKVKAFDKIVLRQQENQPLEGHLFLLKKENEC